MSQSLKKGIDTLLFLAGRKSAGVTELAEELGVNKSTAFRILDTFLEANMVEKNKDTLKYRLGPAILRLSEQYYHNFNIIESARPVMESLSAEIHESVHLCILANNNAVIIEQILSNFRLAVNTKVGNSEPLHCSAIGKCLLSFTSQEHREKIIDGISFDVFTEKTIRDKDRLNEEIRRVQELGYAIDDEELSEHIRCVAVPVFDERGMCIHSLGASGAASRMTDEKIERIVPLLLKAAKSIVIRKGGMLLW